MSESLPWVGPGAAFRFLRELTQETLDDAVNKGLKYDENIEARAEGDNEIVASVCLSFIRH